MSQVTEVSQRWLLASYVLADTWTDFILSRQATRSAPATIAWYQFTAGMFLKWAEGQGVTEPDQIDARLVRSYIAELAERGKADKTMHAHARAIRTLLRFWAAEGYIPEAPRFAMPKLDNKRMLMLSDSTSCLTCIPLNTRRL
jgi:site-specific recombinase XerD